MNKIHESRTTTPDNTEGKSTVEVEILFRGKEYTGLLIVILLYSIIEGIDFI